MSTYFFYGMSMSDKKTNRVKYEAEELDFKLFSSPSELDPSKLKEMFYSIEWIFVPRKLSDRYKDFFYVGSYLDDERRITIKIRPTLQANITESLLDVVSAGGGRTANLGNYCTMRVDESFLSKVKDVAKPLPKKTVKTLSWDD